MPALPVIKISRGNREGIPVNGIEFPYNRALAGIVKERTGASWSANLTNFIAVSAGIPAAASRFVGQFWQIGTRSEFRHKKFAPDR